MGERPGDKGCEEYGTSLRLGVKKKRRSIELSVISVIRTFSPNSLSKIFFGNPIRNPRRKTA
jgi:hypothetical protein